MISYYTAQNLWLLSGISLLSLKVLVGYNIFFLFAGAGSIMVGMLLALHILPQDAFIAQLCCFFGLTVCSSLLFYKPLQRWLYQNQDAPGYRNIVGSIAQVHESNLKYGKCGYVRWSGSIFRAEIVEDSYLHEIPVNSDVKIVALRQNVLIVRGI
ncbi:hypothetical protein EDM53_02535 [Rickettsiales endosymbiont of Peranema trichophorum]|uniref:NfeD family protein n=1 Tax=Rickettsiales endosymbiont of Peranema trichophorum TaxID=2486577 RepID=UPI001022E1C6|nr:hypothetical protein [Rickettsiales endosymbiont of Peranema trichophorum]RZI47324.1 hypothetical protein EDM53_02535 [Rickettsiales endosymbiont of Peranema trichophorum]